jgi:transposase
MCSMKFSIWKSITEVEICGYSTKEIQNRVCFMEKTTKNTVWHLVKEFEEMGTLLNQPC